MMNKLLVSVLLLFSVAVHAQQDAQFTQYMYNTININPAYAGTRGVMSIFGLHRTQWVGLDGAPVTNAFSVNAPISNSKLGIGVSFLNDKIGPIDENTISADISYTIQTSETFKLSFGIKASANLFTLDPTKLNPETPLDPSLVALSSEFSPNIGAGVYWHSDRTYFGFSVPNFIETRRYDDNEVVINQEKLNYYLIAGHVFELSPSLKFKPAMLTKVVAGAPMQLDLSANFQINDRFVLGGAYRLSAAVSGMAGFQIADGLFVGYGYDLETTALRNYNSGSHEIFLRFELFSTYNRIVSPRFF